MTDDQPPADDDRGDRLSDAFVDGRVDEEKLAELLTFREGSHLELPGEEDPRAREARIRAWLAELPAAALANGSTSSQAGAQR